MNTQENNEARDLLKRLVEVKPGLANTEAIIRDINDYLKRTEPAHPAKVAWREIPDAQLLSRFACFLAGYRKGLEDAAGMIKDNGSGVSAQRILDAAGKCPHD